MRRLGWLLLAGAVAACDMSPTALEKLDTGDLEALVTRSVPAGPVQRMWLDLTRDLDAPVLPASEFPGLDSLFALATRVDGRGNAGDASRLEHRAMVDRAWQVLGQGDTDAGERQLTTAREYQADVVVRTLGPATPVVLGTLVGRTLERLNRTGALETPAAEKLRLDAMALSARDLLADSRERLQEGDAVGALDYATHAAGLVNVILRGLRAN